MEKISINELLPTGRVRKIQSGSELLFAYELDKYAKIMLGKEVSLQDVTIAKELLSGEHFSFVVMNNLDVGFVPSRDTLADYSKNSRYFFTETVEGVNFSSVTEDEVVYSFEHDTSANRKLHGDNRSAAYVSLMAYLIVKSQVEGVPVPKLVIDHEQYNQQELEYVDLFVLQDYGNKMIKDMVDVRYSTAWGFQPEWEAFVIFNRQLGRMNQEYTMGDKFKYMKKHFEPGDVVLLYTRTKGAQGKTINKLKECHPAVITSFNNNTVHLTYFPIVQTTTTRVMELEAVANSYEEEGEESIYSSDDYDAFVVAEETFNFTEIGVDMCTWIETTFFIKPVETDGTYQYFSTDEGMDHVWLPTLDTIYAVFEDRKVKYNKEKFLQTYFYSQKRTPIYDQYVKTN